MGFHYNFQNFDLNKKLNNNSDYGEKKKKKLSSKQQKTLSISFIVLVALGLSFAVTTSFSNLGDPKPSETVIEGNTDAVSVEDEKLKESILGSEETDYSQPDLNSSLKIETYTVKSGDTLSEIAQNHGVSIDTICGSNPQKIPSPDNLALGIKLNIPNKEGIIYNVRAGDNIVKLASKYNVSLDKILIENDFVNPDFLSSGDKIFIPDAKPKNLVKGFLCPTRRYCVTSRFGWRMHPIHKTRRFHSGLDLRCKYEWIKASKYGKVTYVGWMGGYGKTVVIAHPGGWKTLYAHLSKPIVRRGQYVKQGQTIARSGNTGISTGPHLHFEVRKHGKCVNPSKYLKR